MKNRDTLWVLLLKGVAILICFCVVVKCGKGCDKMVAEDKETVKQNVYKLRSGDYVLETTRESTYYRNNDTGSYHYIESIKATRDFAAHMAIDTVKLMNHLNQTTHESFKTTGTKR